jgi:hypothetical protein
MPGRSEEHCRCPKDALSHLLDRLLLSLSTE